jgi:outer membrane protein assembly factor BamD
MVQRGTFLSLPFRCSFPNIRTTTFTTGLIAAALLTATLRAPAQASDATQSTAGQPGTPAATTAGQTNSTPAATAQPKSVALINQKPVKTRKQKEDKNENKVVESKDTRKDVKKTKKTDSLEGVDAKLPDKELYDKAVDAVKHGRYDVARLDLQTLLNTYPDSQYMMRSKLAIADSWYKEGGLAALTQAEQEYKDFITFFPNAPEAAEAQMRVGDIYFRQMDRPDRDYSKTIHAEEEYRLMLQQFPDSPLVPQARQRLREVQETLASREADIASFYATHLNWPATIARYQTVVDTYPLYSHMDDVLVGLGDAYEAEAHFVRTLRLPEAGKARLEKVYDDQAYSAYSKVVLEHAAAAHVEDARDRIAAMGLPIPTPTAEQLAASAALENSRGQYTLSKRATVIILRQADTVQAATLGAPPLEDAKPTNAAMIVKKSVADFNTSMNPAAYAQRDAAPLTPTSNAPAAASDSSAPATAPAASAPLAFQDVPATTSGGGGSSAVMASVPATSSAATAGGSALGVEIVQPSSDSTAPVTAPASPPAFPGTADAAPAAVAPAGSPAQANDANSGLKPVGPPDATPLAPIEKAAAAPDAINEATPGSQPPAQTAPADGKKAKPAFDKADESSSKHKKKKGLAKLNPF